MMPWPTTRRCAGLIASYVTRRCSTPSPPSIAKGRFLLIGTTNLDARRPVIWNIGKIAASGHPAALELVADILVASAAIPGAFPPVMIDVEVDGKHYQEMHVDGGASAQVFVYPPALHLRGVSKEAGHRRGSAGPTSSATRGSIRTGREVERQTLEHRRAARSRR